MEFVIKNLGVLKQAQFSLNDLTIICGENNTGKTYVTYALYGFLDFWWKAKTVAVSDETVRHLMNDGIAELNIQEYIDSAPDILNGICEEYATRLSKVFAALATHFSESSFSVKLCANDICPMLQYDRTVGAEPMLSLSVKTDAQHIKIFLSVNEKHRDSESLSAMIRGIIGESIQRILFEKSFPQPFIASAERTGVALFSKEKECIVYIEMKSTTDKHGHIANQLKGARCFMEYCREIAKTFWDQNLRHDYKHRFIAIKHCGSIGKTPIKYIPKVKERGNPEKPAIFAYVPEIQFPVLV